MSPGRDEELLRIAVWMGGWTAEREISLVTGGAVAQALRQGGHQVLEFDLETSAQTLDVLAASRGADAVFVALHGGAGEDGTVQALLELAGVPYVGSGPGPSAVAMDKLWTKHIARELGVLVPEAREVSGRDDAALRREARDFGFPLVCKPVDEGSAVGVILAGDEESLAEALVDLAPRGGRWMLERYVAGREFTVGFVAEEALPLVEIRPRDGFYDYRHKYTPGCTEYDCPAGVDAETAAEMTRAARIAYDGLRLRDMARLDFRLDEAGRAFFLEANTIPGMTGTSLLPMAAAAVGMDFPELCERLCRAAAGRG